MEKYYVFTCANGDKWRVPLEIIARNRAEYYKHEFGDDVERSLREDTMPLFTDDGFEVSDWAMNNMSWSDVEAHAVKVFNGDGDNMETEWSDPSEIFITDNENGERGREI